jgi:hypothetical protein
MRIRLIREDEPPARLRVGDSALFVRRVPEGRRREIAAACRREILRRAAPGDADAMARFMEAVDDRALDYAITGWEGLEGDPECTAAAKAQLPESVKAVVREYMNAPAAGEPEEERLKNSGAPSATPAA